MNNIFSANAINAVALVLFVFFANYIARLFH